MKERLARAREGLREDERALLELRVDKGLTWSEIAAQLGEVSVAALRKKFERTLDELQRLVDQMKPAAPGA